MRLTKVDLIDDTEWLDLMEMEVRDAVQNTVLGEAPILRVSARTGEGLEQLKLNLAELLAETPSTPGFGTPPAAGRQGVFDIRLWNSGHRYSCWMAFYIPVTKWKLCRLVSRGRVRGLQTHKRKVETAFPGSRTAVNISGVEVDQIHRGNVGQQARSL